MHLKCVAKVYRKQIRAGRYFLHEPPSDASSWKEESIQSIRHLPEVATTQCDQCMFGGIADSLNMMTRSPHMKRTRFMSHSAIMLEQLTKKCDRRHVHKPLHGKECEMAAYYPLLSIRALLKGISLKQAENQMRRDHKRDNRRAVQLAVYAARPAQPEAPLVSVLGSSKQNRDEPDERPCH